MCSVIEAYTLFKLQIVFNKLLLSSSAKPNSSKHGSRGLLFNFQCPKHLILMQSLVNLYFNI